MYFRPRGLETYVDVVVVVLLLGGHLVVSLEREVVVLRAVPEIHALRAKQHNVMFLLFNTEGLLHCNTTSVKFVKYAQNFIVLPGNEQARESVNLGSTFQQEIE